jgi:formylglycine-generating enzyme required for sulfatase activity
MPNLRPFKEPEFQDEPSSEVDVRMPLMVRVPGGEYVIGTSNDDINKLLLKESEWAYDWSDNDLFDSERPQHRVMIETFEIAQFPVTNQEYYAFTSDTGHALPRTWTGFTYSGELANHPVTGVSRHDARDYIQWLNAKTGKVFRLPTEVEWEAASRGKDGRIYPWGNTFDPWRCNTSESAKRGTTAVGVFSPGGDSPVGAADMVGNVWEWTSSVFAKYPYRPERESTPPTENTRYVARGGAWYYSRKLARCSAREGMRDEYRSHLVGFRVARTP